MPFGQLPPGLQGFVAADQLRQQGEANEIGKASSLAGLFNNMRAAQESAMLAPLRREQLQLSVDNARRNAQLRQQLMGGSTGATETGATPGGPAQPSSLSDMSGAIPRNVQAMLLSGDSGLSSLAKAYLEQNKPVPVAEGGALMSRDGRVLGTRPKLGENVLPVYDDKGQVIGVRPMPGAAEAAANVTTATEAAKAGFDFIDVPVPGGGTQKMTRAQAAQLFTQQLGAPQGRSAQELAAIRAVQQADAAGLPASVTVPAAQLGVPASPSGVTVARPGFQESEVTRAAEKTTAEARAKSGVEREDKLRQSWSDANDVLSKLDVIESLSKDPSVASGAAADTISNLKGIADSLGVRTTGLPAEEVIRGIATEMSLRIKNQGGTNMMPGAMSDFEQKLLQSMTPRLAQSKEGRMLMIQVFRAKAHRDQQIAEMASQYIDRYGKLDNGFDNQVRLFAKSNPMIDPQRLAAMSELAKRLGAQ